MSLAIETMVRSWGLLGVETRELLAQLVRAARGLNRGLAVPDAQPGFDRPVFDTLGSESSADELRAALEAYDDLATRHQGLPLDTLLGVRTVPAPEWYQLQQTAERNAGVGLRASVEMLAVAYQSLRLDANAIVARITDTQSRAWLSTRLESVRRQPTQSGGGKWVLLALGVGYVLFGGDRK